MQFKKVNTRGNCVCVRTRSFSNGMLWPLGRSALAQSVCRLISLFQVNKAKSIRIKHKNTSNQREKLFIVF